MYFCMTFAIPKELVVVLLTFGRAYVASVEHTVDIDEILHKLNVLLVGEVLLRGRCGLVEMAKIE